MATIDDVIARSRQPGGFSERKRFTVARHRAIRKMREFALADPHFYVLELIQAAVANGATHVDLRCEKRSFGLSYVGGGFVREELAQLFDFLFASKSDMAHGDIRQLALGVNALMIMAPGRIVIESGDGTLEGTTRISILGDSDTVDLGTPDRPLDGTYVSAEGLDRSEIAGKSNLRPTDYGPRETMAIEERCLAAPVPILVNDQPIFGYSSVRCPDIFGYDNPVAIDEGDLYGTIGLATKSERAFVKLMTYGVWIQSLPLEPIEGVALGGVLCFDRLNKTADHAAIVQDERLAALNARLRPYARQIQSGRPKDAVYDIAPLGGERFSPRELRAFLADHDRIILAPARTAKDSKPGRRARAIGEHLGAPVLRGGPEQLETLQNLAGSDADILVPVLDDLDELTFFSGQPAEPVARPWLVGASTLAPIGVAAFVELLEAEGVLDPSTADAAEVRAALGHRGTIRTTVYTPRHGRSQNAVWVRVLTLGRLLWEGAVPSAYPGHVLDVELPAASAVRFATTPVVAGSMALGQIVAEVEAARAADVLAAARRRVLDSLGHDDLAAGSTAAHIALSEIARSCIKRLRTTGDGAGSASVDLSLLGHEGDTDLLGLPLLVTLDGEGRSMREVAAAMESTGGLVYGVVPQVDADLDGLDTSRILDLDLTSEQLLIDVVGEASYVRIDQRDVLASAGGWQLRDLALGLRDYPADVALLVEPDPDADRRDPPQEVVRPLVEQLTRVYAGAVDDLSDDDHRRQAVRHLQWFAARTMGDPAPGRLGVDQMGLFLDGHSQVRSFAELRAGAEAHGRIEMVDGRSADITDLGELARHGARPQTRSDAGEATGQDAAALPASLMMSTWVYFVLRDALPLAGAFDFDLTDAEAARITTTPDAAYLLSTDIDQDVATGQLGIVAGESPGAVAVIAADRSHTWALRSVELSAGLAGHLVLSGAPAVSSQALRSRLHDVVSRSIQRLLAQALEAVRQADLDGPRGRRLLESLLDWTSRHVKLYERPDGSVAVTVDHHLAQRVLDLPCLPSAHGLPVSIHRAIDAFCVGRAAGQTTWRESTRVLIDQAPAPAVAWLDRHVHLGNVRRPAGDRRRAAAPTDHGGSDAGGQLTARRIGEAIARFRTDAFAERALRVLVVDPGTFEAGSPVAQQLAAGHAFAFENSGYAEPTLYVHRDHPLVETVRRRPDDPRALAWLVLAAYAHVNAVLEPVNNDHELAFQRRISQALRQGTLVDRPSPAGV